MPNSFNGLGFQRPVKDAGNRLRGAVGQAIASGAIASGSVVTVGLELMSSLTTLPGTYNLNGSHYSDSIFYQGALYVYWVSGGSSSLTTKIDSSGATVIGLPLSYLNGRGNDPKFLIINDELHLIGGLEQDFKLVAGAWQYVSQFETTNPLDVCNAAAIRFKNQTYILESTSPNYVVYVADVLTGGTRVTLTSSGTAGYGYTSPQFFVANDNLYLAMVNNAGSGVRTWKLVAGAWQKLADTVGLPSTPASAFGCYTYNGEAYMVCGFTANATGVRAIVLLKLVADAWVICAKIPGPYSWPTGSQAYYVGCYRLMLTTLPDGNVFIVCNMQAVANFFSVFAAVPDGLVNVTTGLEIEATGIPFSSDSLYIGYLADVGKIVLGEICASAPVYSGRYMMEIPTSQVTKKVVGSPYVGLSKGAYIDGQVGSFAKIR